MILYCIKCLMFAKIKLEIDENINLCSRCIDCDFKKCAATDDKELSYLLKALI